MNTIYFKLNYRIKRVINNSYKHFNSLINSRLYIFIFIVILDCAVVPIGTQLVSAQVQQNVTYPGVGVHMGLLPEDESYIPKFERIATNQEMNHTRKWVYSRFCAELSTPPFSFVYNGHSSSEIFKTWHTERSETKLDNNRKGRVLTYTDAITHLVIRCQAIEYSDYPAVEWVIYFKNTGINDTPILEKVQALDIVQTSNHGSGFVVHHARGSNSAMNDFQPLNDTLAPSSSLRLHSFGLHPWGMSSVESLPFFNVETTGKGIIAAIGWSGAWSAEFIRDGSDSLHIRSGMDTTHLILHPGEEIRTPRMVILHWEGDRIRAHNLWRRFLLEHYTPQPGGKMVKVPLCDSSWGELTANEQIGKIDWWKEHNLPMECFWIDAGWNGLKGEDCFTAATNRVPRKDLYPFGMKQVSDAAHLAGMKFLLWTWPHTARVGAEIGLEHPEWVLPGNGLDHGNPVVNRWMIDKYSRSVDEHGLDVFRQDGHSIYPKDTSGNRTGMSQIRYTEGFYEFWDALIRNHPNLIIDNCAGGGRKIDIETMKRSIPLWRSDYQSGPKGLLDFDPIGIQSQTWGLSQWVPLSAAATSQNNVYAFRSAYSPGLVICRNLFKKKPDSSDYDFDLYRRLLTEYLSVRKFFYGDYYPLSSYSLDSNAWMAWQFDRPDLREGIVQAFRRTKSTDESATYKLVGLDSRAKYTISNLDEPGIIIKSGRELMSDGISVTIKDCPGAVIWKYRVIK